MRWSFERSRDENQGQEKPFMGTGEESWVILEGARQSGLLKTCQDAKEQYNQNMSQIEMKIKIRRHAMLIQNRKMGWGSGGNIGAFS